MMAEDNVKKHKEDTHRNEEYRNADVTVGTSATKMIGKKQAWRFTDFSMTWFNENGSYDVTGKVWVSNKRNPTEIGSSGWTDDWSQLGSDITITAGTTKAKQWTGRYGWFGVSASASTATSTDNDVEVIASN